MNRQHADAELSGFANCGSDGGGDVMIFQIEKDTPAWSHQFAHDLRAFGGVELHADFISGSGVAHGRHNLSGSDRGGHVESDDQVLPRVINWASVYQTIVYQTIVYQSSTHQGEFKRFAAAGLWLKRHGLQHRHGLRLGHLRLNQVQTDPLQTLSLELEHASGAVRNVYDPAGNYGAAIIDFDDYRAPVAQIGDPHEAAQGQSWVGGGQVVHIIRLAAGGRLALEIVSIPGGGANLVGLRLSRFVARFL